MPAKGLSLSDDLAKARPLRPLGAHVALVQDANGAPWARKALAPNLRDQAAARLRFRLEAWRAAQLAGPRLAPAWHGEADAAEPWYAMAYVDGPPATILPPNEQLQALAQAAEALAALHARGWVHAALEPEALRRTEGGLVLIAYGDVVAAGEAPWRVTASRFAAPERRLGQALDARADLWSLGALLRYWATGAPPLAGAEAAWDGAPVDTAVGAFAAWLGAPSPQDRPADAWALLEALEEGTPRLGGKVVGGGWVAPPKLAPPEQEGIESTLLGAWRQGEAIAYRLEAPAGAGKSHLLEALAHRAAEAGAGVWRMEGGGPWAAPMAAWQQALGPLAPQPPTPPPAEALLAPSAERRAATQLAVQAAEALKRSAPQGGLLLLDAWEACDEATQALAKAVLLAVGPYPLVVLAAGRAVAWPEAERLQLGPWPTERLEGWLAHLPEGTAQRAARAQYPGRALAAAHAPPEAPGPPKAAAALAPALAALGTRPQPEDLLARWPKGPELPAALDALLVAGALRPASGGAYAFVWPEAEAWAQDLGPAGAQVLHAACAAARPLSEASRQPRLRHLLLAEGGDPGALAAELCAAARQALALGAPHTAEAWLEEALAMAPQGATVRAEALALLAGRLLGRQEQASAAAAAQAALEALSGGPLRRELLLLAATAQPSPEAWAAALAEAAASGDEARRARALLGLAEQAGLSGDHAAALAHAEAALGAAIAGRDAQARATAEQGLAERLLAGAPERRAEALALLRDAAKGLGDLGEVGRAAASAALWAEAELVGGRPAAALAAASLARPGAAEAPEAAGAAARLAALAAWMVGETAVARQVLQEAPRPSEGVAQAEWEALWALVGAGPSPQAADPQREGPWQRVRRLLMRAELAGPSEAGPWVEAALQALNKAPFAPGLRGWAEALAGEAAMGRQDAAEARLRFLSVLASQAPWPTARAAYALGRLARAEGHQAEARGWFDQAQRLADALGWGALAEACEAAKDEALAQHPDPVGRATALVEEALTLLRTAAASAPTPQLAAELAALRVRDALWRALAAAPPGPARAQAVLEVSLTHVGASLAVLTSPDGRALLARDRHGSLEPHADMAPPAAILEARLTGQAAAHAGTPPALAIPLLGPEGRTQAVLVLHGLDADGPEAQAAQALADAAALAWSGPHPV